MHEDTRWKLIAGIGLVNLSLAFLTAHYLVFIGCASPVYFFMGDLAFIPIEVLIVTIIIDQMLVSRDRQQRMEKLNMVIGIFFSRVGTQLLDRFAKADPGEMPLWKRMAGGNDLTVEKFKAMHSGPGGWHAKVDPARVDMDALREFLLQK
jgi:hypothetical protein